MSCHIEVRRLELPMTERLQNAHRSIDSRRTIIVRVTLDGTTGTGECVALDSGYRGQSHDVEYDFIVDQLSPGRTHGPMSGAVGHPTSVAAFADATLATSRPTGSVPVIGVVGLQHGDELLSSVQRLLEFGYREVKAKIAPGAEMERLALLEDAFPGVVTRVDANGSYDPREIEHRELLSRLDRCGLHMIEQPVPIGSETLLGAMETLVAWDESASDATAIRRLARAGARAVVLKPGFLGGLAASIDIASWCIDNGVEPFVGGSIESPVGRMSTMHLAASVPGDRACEIAPVQRWFTGLGTEPVEEGHLSLAVCDRDWWTLLEPFVIEHMTC